MQFICFKVFVNYYISIKNFVKRWPSSSLSLSSVAQLPSSVYSWSWSLALGLLIWSWILIEIKLLACWADCLRLRCYASDEVRVPLFPTTEETIDSPYFNVSLSCSCPCLSCGESKPTKQSPPHSVVRGSLSAFMPRFFSSLFYFIYLFYLFIWPNVFRRFGDRP